MPATQEPVKTELHTRLEREGWELISNFKRRDPFLEIRLWADPKVNPDNYTIDDCIRKYKKEGYKVLVVDAFDIYGNPLPGCVALYVKPGENTSLPN